MRLNLLLHIDNFRWEDITINRSGNIDNLSIGLETIMACEDKCWQHPDAFNLCYAKWGCFHELLSLENFQDVKDLVGWIEHRHYKTLLKLWRFVSSYQSQHNNYNI